MSSVNIRFLSYQISARVAYQGGNSYVVKVDSSAGDKVYTVRGGLEEDPETGRDELVCAVDGIVSRQRVLVTEDRYGIQFRERERLLSFMKFDSSQKKSSKLFLTSKLGLKLFSFQSPPVLP